MTLAVALALGLDWEDLVQAEALAQLEGVSRGAAWDRLARDLGWRRARPDLAEVELCGRTRASLSGDLAAAVHEAARIATTYHYRWGGLPAGPRYGVGGRLGTSRVGVGYREGG